MWYTKYSGNEKSLPLFFIMSCERGTMYENDTFEFRFSSGNKMATVEIGQSQPVNLTDVLKAMQNILIAGGYDYVDEVRAVSYGEKENQIYTSNTEDDMWIESSDGLERRMAKETILNAGVQAEKNSESWAGEELPF